MNLFGSIVRRRSNYKYYLLIAIAPIFLLGSFAKGPVPALQVARYYDDQLDSLLHAAYLLQKECSKATDATKQVQAFLHCRNAYKRVELLIDVFSPYKARALNGPDLTKVEEENPGDPLYAHGLQVMEAALYTTPVNKIKLPARNSTIYPEY